MSQPKKTLVTLWAAFADPDTAALNRLCDTFDREFWHSKFDLHFINGSWGNLSDLLRNASDDADPITEKMKEADYVLACLTPGLIEEDLVAQLRRAHALGKEIIVFYFGRVCDENGKPLSPRFSADLFLLLQGSKQVALWGTPTKELEAIFSGETTSDPSPDKHPTVFLSHKHEDYELAKSVYDHVTEIGCDAFLSEVSLPQLGSCDYMKEIDNALDSAEHMIVAGTSTENIMSGWVEAEWRLFINEKRSGRKSGNIVTVIDSGLNHGDLPMSLRYYEVIDLNSESMERIGKYVLPASG